MSPVLPTRVHPGQAIQLVVPSYDGHLYVVDSLTGKPQLCQAVQSHQRTWSALAGESHLQFSS